MLILYGDMINYHHGLLILVAWLLFVVKGVVRHWWGRGSGQGSNVQR
jgi:hypothetical protein